MRTKALDRDFFLFFLAFYFLTLARTILFLQHARVCYCVVPLVFFIFNFQFSSLHQPECEFVPESHRLQVEQPQGRPSRKNFPQVADGSRPDRALAWQRRRQLHPTFFVEYVAGASSSCAILRNAPQNARLRSITLIFQYISIAQFHEIAVFLAQYCALLREILRNSEKYCASDFAKFALLRNQVFIDCAILAQFFRVFYKNLRNVSQLLRKAREILRNCCAIFRSSCATIAESEITQTRQFSVILRNRPGKLRNTSQPKSISRIPLQSCESSPYRPAPER